MSLRYPHIFAQDRLDRGNVILDGNRFLLANGHIGYRGTVEEYGREEMVGLIIAGVYDQYQDSWRENLALPNPFLFRAYKEGKEISIRTEEPLSHQVKLDFDRGVYTRRSSLSKLIISSSRIVSHDDDSLLFTRIEVEAKEEGEYELVYGIDTDINEIHGPHFAKQIIENAANRLCFKGKTNEGKILFVSAEYRGFAGIYQKEDGFFHAKLELKPHQKLSLEIIARVDEDALGEIPNDRYSVLAKASIQAFARKWGRCKVIIEGDAELDYELAYSMYHALILGDEKRIRSIAARGLSGQTYKGAIFWDTEIFLLPFYVLANPKIARNLLLYRINTLPGALAKAKSLGYEGAYYAWESQDSGLEACRADNVTDPVTGETVVTYFGTKQIHISADVVYAFDRYIEATGDMSVLKEGGDKVIFEVAKFFLSYSTVDDQGIYHINDVIGPDEYHERVNDEAFTLALARRVMRILGKYVDPKSLSQEDQEIYNRCVEAEFASPQTRNGVIAEFDGYFDLEDIDVASLKKRVKNPQDYWGGKHGIATHTQVIKQADVVSLMALCPEDFDRESMERNYDYYLSRTEHGSSLSASMHCLLGAKLGKEKEAYQFLRNSSGIDIRGAEKLYAGGVYIGGTHPAANAGAYLGLVYGFLGLKEIEGRVTFDVHLPRRIHSVKLRYCVGKEVYEVTCDQRGVVKKKEVRV
ncbi:MAG: glycoside hydrolase family 65 protein [Bacilli bacterium]|nr:glycoside hydrolase family 65 protein [Bacilli bacterium]